MSGMSDVAIEKALDNLDKEVKTLKEILSHRQRNSMPKFKGFVFNIVKKLTKFASTLPKSSRV